MVEGAGFEPAKVKPPDLQSGPVGRLGNPSNFMTKILNQLNTNLYLDNFAEFL